MNDIPRGFSNDELNNQILSQVLAHQTEILNRLDKIELLLDNIVLRQEKTNRRFIAKIHRLEARIDTIEKDYAEIKARAGKQ